MSQQVIDIHCHPALKTWLFPSHHVYDEVSPHGYEFSENCFVNIDQMQRGDVGMAVSVYYLPETELWTVLKLNSFLLRVLKDALTIVCNRLPLILEDKSTPSAAFEQMKGYITSFENDVIYAKLNRGYNVAIAHSHTELQNLINDGTTVFLNSIEGIHCLGNGEIDQATLKANLQYFFDAGVCQITLGHFFENILVSSSGGIAPKLATEINYDPKKFNTYEKGYNGQLAIDMIDQMLELGIVIDLVHSHAGAKQMVFERNNLRGAKKRPLTFAHTGVRGVANKNNTMPEAYADYLPDDADIRAIKDCNGLLGVIFMDYWLTGNDDYKPSIAAVIETMVYIRNIADSKGNKGTYDHIAIGSDLDGFTTIPEDLGGERMMTDLVQAIRAIPDITAEDVDKICWGNYMRVLKDGWGKMV